mmetsp:Transcript_25264/g.59127  ORF Transcript_25264/g.59127 Transcript_25264/m.59127 type:complete len:715 (+) Transcript_25264:233-2377(+)
MNTMNTCVKYVDIILLAFLITAGQASPPASTEVCRDDSSELYRNSFPVNTEMGDLAEWTEAHRSTPGQVCTRRSGIKTTCVIDYTNTTESTDWCLDVPKTLYIETTFIYRCTNHNNKKQMYYSVKNRPACYASSCFDGYDSSILEGLERASFDGLIEEFKNPNTDSEWRDADGFDECVQMRFEITEPVVSEAVTGSVGVVHASPTSSPAPSISPAPSLRPTGSFAPTASSAPTYAPMDLTCETESIELVSNDADFPRSQIRTAGTSNPNRAVGVAEGLSKIEEILVIDTNTGRGFDKHCKTVEIDDFQNVTALCEFDYDDVIEFIAGTDDSIAALCQAANGVYVEDSISIMCTSDEDPSITTRLVINNKPSCRSKLCNADGVREVATTEFDRWMKLTLEEGLDEAFAKEFDAETVEILSGPQSCVIDSDDDAEELIVVAVGGSSLSNIGGEPIPPTDECQAFTTAVDGTIGIYNQKAMFQRELLDYVSDDMRQICGSTTPGLLECDFDWNEILASSERSADGDTMKSACMPDGNGSSGSGQYIESIFEVTCTDPSGDQLVMTNTNVPGCTGRPCTPGQAEYLLEDDYTFLADKFIAEGWTCATDVISVFAPHYNPFIESYSMEEINSDPAFNTLDVDGNPDDTIHTAGANVNPPTLAPTGDAFHRGQKYGALLRTQAPSAAYVEPQTTSSSYSRFSGTMTVLLMLPIALSLLNF